MQSQYLRRLHSGRRNNLLPFTPAIVLAAFLILALNSIHARRGSMKISSSQFDSGGSIPLQYTCDGENLSPPLEFGAIPESAKSLALIVDDPDAPAGIWVHWVLYNLPAGVHSLPEGIPPRASLDNGAKQGINDFRKSGYGGPCPPGGTHRYNFRLFALDRMLDAPAGLTKKELLKTIQGHVLEEAVLMGRYTRQR